MCSNPFSIPLGCPFRMARLTLLEKYNITMVSSAQVNVGKKDFLIGRDYNTPTRHGDFLLARRPKDKGGQRSQ